VGIDIDADCIATCKRTNPYGNFERCEIAPPVRFAAGSLDVIYAYSVFSHLSEGAQLQWIGELGRVLRPGGMLIVTTLKREHLGVWLRLRDEEQHPWWKENLRRIEFDINKFAAFYDSGEKFLYCPTGGGGIRSADFYGEAIVSPAYIRRAWAKEFELVEHRNDRDDAPQALIVCRRR
jgi:SAM-dependent methyltransferase